MAETSSRLRRWFGSDLVPPKIATYLQYLCRYLYADLRIFTIRLGLRVTSATKCKSYSNSAGS
jgi:hypothetical protein